MKMKAMGLVLAVLSFAIACDPSQDYCQKISACKEEIEDETGEKEELDEDAVEVCVALNDGFTDSVAANDESECEDYLTARADLMACLVGLDCDDFAKVAANEGNSCKEERKALGKAAKDAQAKCATVVNADLIGEL